MTSTGRWVLGVVVLVIIVLLLALVAKSGKETPAPAENKEPIKIGMTVPLSEDMANAGENAKAAVEIAVEEINAAGGIGGRPLVVIYEDDKCKGDAGANAANKLISIDKVTAILGGTCSPATLAEAPIAEAAKIPQLSYCSTAPKISEAGDYIFRDVPSDLYQAKFAADYIYNTMGKKKAAVLNINNDWGNGVSGAFRESFKALGGSVVFEEAFLPDTKDLRSQMTKVKKSGADILYFAGFTDNSIAGIKQFKELGLKIPAFGADAWDDTKIWQEVGPAGEGMMFTAAASNSSEDFKIKMQAKLGTDEIIYCSNYAYDGAKMLAKAISEVGTDGTAIKNALYGMHYEGGVGQSSYEFDANGDPKTAVYALKVVKDGKAEVLPMPTQAETPAATSTQ